MASVRPRPTQMRRQAGLALLDAEEILDEVARERAALEDAAADRGRGEFDTALERIEVSARRLRETLKGTGGVSVEQAAQRLRVTDPTVRKWIGEGFLDAISDRKPLEVDPRSVVRVERVLENVRESYPSREWTRALAAFLHDRDLVRKLGVAEAIEEIERGEYVEL